MGRFIIGRRRGRMSLAIAIRLRVIAEKLSRRLVTLVAVNLSPRLVLAIHISSFQGSFSLQRRFSSDGQCALSRYLLFPHRKVHPFGSEKSLVVATFDDRSSVQHNDLIGMGDGGQSVSTEKRKLRVSFKSVVLGLDDSCQGGGDFPLTQ